MTDNLFHEIPDVQVILRTKGGVFKQAKVFRRGTSVYAAHGGGYIRLMGYSGTSAPTVSWSDLHDGYGHSRLRTSVTGLPRWSNA